MMELLNYGKHPFDDEELNTKKLIIERIVHPKWEFSDNFTRLGLKN